MKLHPSHKQSGIAAILLVILLTGILAVICLVVYRHNKARVPELGAATNSSKIDPSKQTEITGKISNSMQVTPTAFVHTLLGTLTNGDEDTLKQLITPAFRNFRQQNLAKSAHCNYPPAHSLLCDSLLDASSVHGFSDLNPSIANFTFKNGQKGESITYQSSQGGSDPGTTYYSFKLLPKGNGWLLNDYIDTFDQPGNTSSASLIGEMDMSR